MNNDENSAYNFDLGVISRYPLCTSKYLSWKIVDNSG